MMNSKYTLTIILLSGLVLGGCSSGKSSSNSSDDGGGTSNSGDDSAQDEPIAGETLAAFGGQSADDEPMAITVQLEDDIQAVLGDADNTATDVVAGDTVQTVIDRAQ